MSKISMAGRSVLKGTGLLVGMIIGAGMFAMPYVVVQAGLLPALFFFVLAGVLVTLTHLLYGRIFYHYRIHDHRLPGYVRSEMGEGHYWIVLITRLGSYFGYLLAYGVLAGLLLSYLVPDGGGAYVISILFFVVIAPVLLMEIAGTGATNFILTVVLIIFTFILFIALAPRFDYSSIFVFSASTNSWFLPYGIFLFAFSGASVIPEVVEIFRGGSKKFFAPTVIFSTFVVALVYIIFIATILGVSGGDVSQDGLRTLSAHASTSLFLLGTFIGLLAILTSHIALALELRYTLEYDLEQSRFTAWALVVCVPLCLFIIGINQFSLILSVVGAIGVGIEGLYITLLAHHVLRTNEFLVGALVVVFVVGAILEVVGVVGVL